MIPRIADYSESQHDFAAHDTQSEAPFIVDASHFYGSNVSVKLTPKHDQYFTLSLGLPPFFLPVVVDNFTSPIIHYDRNTTLVITCKYVPQEYQGSSSLPLDSDTVYIVKMSLTPSSVSQLENDASISRYLEKSLKANHVAPSIHAYLKDYFIIVKEYISGSSLKRLTMEKPTADLDTLQKTLEVAIKLCSGVDQLHMMRVVHCDLSPENIIWGQSTVTIIDFGLSELLPLSTPYVYTSNPKGNVRYMSPEATGRLPKPLGFYSDIYSLGFVLFEMIAKDHPFNNCVKSSDYIFSHITKQPESLYQNLKRREIIKDENSTFATVVHAIALVVNKMVQKSFDKRYFCMEGVIADLDIILKCIQKEDNSCLHNFIPGQHDVQTTISIPFVVYGRDSIIDEMNTRLQTMIDMQVPTLIMVRGYSGVGKTSIVQEFRNRCKDKIVYLEAKYDQNQNVPFFAFTSIISTIIETVLGETEEFISEFKSYVLAWLNITQLEMLSEVITNFSLLFPSYQSRSSAFVLEEHQEAVKWFSQGVIFLLKAYNQMQHKPITIFIDNVQRIDFESIKLLKEMMGLGTCEVFPLLLIFAYRDNEVKDNNYHPLNIFLKSARSIRGPVTDIEVPELTEEDCNNLVSVSLHRTPRDTENLTKVLYSKTKGNPFFLKQMLVTLFKEEKIFFNRTLQAISWNLEEIGQVKYSQNVVDFLLIRFDYMPPDTKKALAYASCIGCKALLPHLFHLMNLTNDEYSTLGLKESLEHGVQEGWISYINSHTLQFNHDRLQYAANSSLSEKEKTKIHYTYGKYLLQKVKAGEMALEEAIFDIVVHLNHRSKDPKMLNSPKKRRRLLELNKMAAKKAISSCCAIEQAKVFANTSLEILRLEKDVWMEPLYQTTFELFMIHGNCEYVTNVESAISIFNTALKKAKTRLHIFEACYNLEMCYLTQGKFEAVFELLTTHFFPAFEELKFLTVPSNRNVDVLREWIDNKMKDMKKNLIPKFTKKDVLELPDMTDPENMYFIQMLSQGSPAIFHMKSLDTMHTPNSRFIFMTCMLIGMEKVLTNGMCLDAPILLALCSHFWSTYDIWPRMTIFIEASIEISRNRYKNQQHWSSCLLLKIMDFALFPNINALEVWNLMEEAFLLTVKCNNNRGYGVFTITYYPFYHFFFANSDIKTSIELSKQCIAVIKDIGNCVLLDTSNMILEMKRVICGEAESFDPAYTCDIVHYPVFRCMHFLFKAISLYFQQQLEESFACIEQTFDFKEEALGMCVEWVMVISQGLICCAVQKYILLNHIANQEERLQKSDKIIEDVLQRLERLCQCNSLIFPSPFALIKAEKLFCDYLRFGHDNTRSIINLMTQSLTLATQERNHFMVKLCNLKLGELFKDLNLFDSISGKYFFNAYEQFNEMGASLMVNHICEKYKNQIDTYEREMGTSVASSMSSSSTIQQEFALTTITKTRFAEINQVDFKEIFISILPLLNEKTDSNRCCLLLKRNSNIYLDAELIDELNPKESILPHLNLEEASIDKIADRLPRKMIYRTIRTRYEQVFSQSKEIDPYFENSHIASALCLPIIREKSVIGCIYLENREIEDSFTVEKLNTAKLIISISIDNAKIFSSINNSYARFLPSEFLKLLGKSHVTKVRPGDAISREMTVLFSDIYGFTELMESLSAKEGFSFMNRLLFRTAPPISKYGGFIDKILGDGIMALFPDPLSAVKASLEMISELEKFNTENVYSVTMGIGVSNGVVSLGTIGYKDRLDATVISDSTNVASRCESLSRSFKSRIIVTESVINGSSQIPHQDAYIIYIGKFILKGKHIARDLYAVKGKKWKTIIQNADLFEKSTISQVVSLFQSRKFDQCLELTKQIRNDSTTSNPFVLAMCRFYSQACDIYSNCKLPESWSGDIRLSKDGEPKPYFLEESYHSWSNVQ
ncbi:hypothetical protein C9374_003823 [Naegleria lovaniensis]|uniref:Guanylate cyclase n=1 Tax=Naegleria lovaniensis TaxID=51637 RepID=A0AA88KSZ0_NAELO|nr:uncharacterized protein C9374_003823 [Naegleria lovaniensis]KAG2394059.1 hypothetical protein C9374_003823 [Naegleria lovaniensis]